MTTILYFDCFAGISGDMILGALLDLGVDKDFLLKQLSSLGVDGYRLSISQKQVSGITGTDFDVIIEKEQTHHRHLSDIEAIINNSSIIGEAKDLSKKIFRLIAQSEAKIHGKTIEEIHFHEVGAIDSIVDIVGAAICLTTLNPDKILSSPLHVGSGTVTCAHGILPVPAPATADILTGIPIYSTEVKGELVTPTGAAIIKTIADDFVPMPAMVIEKTGYGSGKKQFKIPNLLRVFSGVDQDKSSGIDQVMMLETNIDDMNPELFSYLLPLLLEKGALEAYLTQIVMKKGRPGIMLSVLCDPNHLEIMEQLIFTETSTLGIRKRLLERSRLDRKSFTIETGLGAVSIKAAYKDGKFLKASPEYEDCRKLAREHNLSLKKVYELVTASEAFLQHTSKL